MSKSWSIGVAGWIFLDDNYSAFHLNEERQFAVEFNISNFSHSKKEEITAEQIDREEYRVNAKVLYIDENLWVVDFGIKAYAERLNLPGEMKRSASTIKEDRFISELKTEQYIQADIQISVDHYAYMEYLCKIENVPALIYHWQLDTINQFVSAKKWLPVDYAWGNYSYELKCTLLAQAPHSNGKLLIDRFEGTSSGGGI